MKQPHKDATEQVFILGAPRSGTTFTASLLNETRFGVPVETHFIPKYLDKLDSYGNLDVRANFCTLVQDILRERPVAQWRLALLPERLFENLEEPRSYPNIINALFAARDESTPSAWGDKTPWYINRLASLAEIFPKARFIYVIRDGRDVALSLLNREWGPNNLYACAKYWSELNLSNPAIEALHKQGRLISIRYEDLLDSPEPNIRHIYRFLQSDISDEELAVHVTNTRGSNQNKWKTALTPKQQQMFESIAGKQLKEHGYPLVCNANESINTMAALWFRLHDKLVWAKFMFKQNVVDGFRIRFLGKEPFAE